MMNEFKQNWKTIILMCFINLIAFVVSTNWTDAHNKAKNAASVEYVDTKDKELKTEVDKKVSKDEFQLILKQLQNIENTQSDIQRNQNSIYQLIATQKK